MRGNTSTFLAIALVGATMVAVFSPSGASAAEVNGPNPIYFPETGQYLGAPFLSYWQQHGGVATFGYPISGQVQFKSENGPLAQYFQRAVFEYHPIAPAGGTIELRLLGDEYSANMRKDAPFQPINAANNPDCTFYAITGHQVCFGFRDYWQSHGGLAVFGYPISDELTESGLTVQYFQRARFEYHPTNPVKYQVELGLLGSWAASQDHIDTTPQPLDAVTGIWADSTGARGSTAWALRSTDLLVTTDAGAHWSDVPLPTGVAARNQEPTTAAYVDQANALWLLTSYGNTATFYRAASPTSPWIKTTVKLTWPSNAPTTSMVSPGERTSTFGSSNTGVVVAEVSEEGGNVAPVSLILESTDKGKVFQQQDPPALEGIWNLAFTSAMDGFAFGPYGYQPSVFHTTNGGKTWLPTAISGYRSATASNFLFNSPQAVGSRIYLPATTFTMKGVAIEQQLDDLYVSADGGATFTLIHSMPVPAKDGAPPTLGGSGNDVWLIPNSGGAIAESTDAGGTWKTVTTSDLSGGYVENIGLVSSSEATAWRLHQNCFDYECTYSGTLLVTAGGGARWQPSAAPPK